MSDGAGGIYLRTGGLYLTSFGTDWLLDHLTVIKNDTAPKEDITIDQEVCK